MDRTPAMTLLHPEQPTPAVHARAQVAGDVTLPGSLREVPTILYAGATAVVESAEAMQDQASVSGRAVFRVLYTQGERTDSIEASADFTQRCELPGCTAHSDVEARAQVTKVDATVSGGRLSVRAALDVAARAVLTDPVEAIADLPGPDVQKRTATVKLRRTLARGSQDVLLREEFALPEDLGVRDTLSAQAVAAMTDVSGGQGRIGLTGEIALEALHLTDVPGKPILTTRHAIPVQQAVEVLGAPGEMLDGRITVKDVAVASQMSDAGTVLRAEVLLGLSAWSEGEEDVSILTDAYTTSGDALRLTKAELPLHTGSIHEHTAESWKAPLLLPEGSKPLRTVMAVFAAPAVTGWEQQGSRLNVTGTVDAALVYMPDDGAAPAAARIQLPLKAAFNAEAAPEDFVSLSAVQVEAVPITSDRAELRCVLQLEVDGQRTQSVPLVTEVAAIPAPPEVKDIVLCFAQAGETWWDIARRYRVTEERLHALNPDLQGDIKPGQGAVVWRPCTD